MSLNLRRQGGPLVLAGLLASLLFLGRAQSQVKVAAPALPTPAAPGTAPAENKDANDFSHALTLPTDSKMQRRMERAVDLMTEKEPNWAEAAKSLQALLDAPEDVFVKVTRKDSAGKESTHWTSVRAESNRLLGTFPENGLSFYELQFGGVARAKLDEAKAKGDPQILADVAQKYLHTRAGAEATNLLGTYHLDRGHFVMAALCFERLLGREGDKVSTATLVKGALAFHRIGDKERAVQAWKAITARAGREGLKLGERTVSLTDLDKIIKKYDQPLSELFSPSDWVMFKGNASRSAQGNGTAPYMERKWSVEGNEYIREAETRRLINLAIKSQLDTNQPILPAFFPIAVDGKVIFRSYYGVHAYDIKTGTLEWEASTKGSLDHTFGDSQRTSFMQAWSQYYEQADKNLFYENSTLGTLSSDNERVYVVEDLALPPHPHYLLTMGWNAGWGGGMSPNYGPLSDAVHHNKLQVIEIKTGKILWELGGRASTVAADNKVTDAESLTDSYFLGPPLPLGGKLYVLNEKNQELRLVCLDPTKNAYRGENPVVWSQTLAAMREKILQDVSRRIRVASLAYGDGIIVCPTNAGAVLGVDLLSHSLVWAYAYRDKSQADSPEEEQRKQLRAQPWRVQQQGTIPVGPEQWKASTPIIQDGKVVFTASDGAKVFCLNLRDGSLRWNAERKDDLYLAGVYNGRVLLVGKNSCRALNLDDGKQLWTLETGMPSGQGVASNNVYYLPLRSGAHTKEPEVCLINIEKGTIEAQPKSRKREVPGNLIFFEGDVISQSATELAVYPQLRVKRRQMDDLIAKNPKDPRGLTERGELRLDEGDFQGAIDDLHLALENHPPADVLPKTRAKLYETLTAVMQYKFNEGEKYLDEYKDLCKVETTPAMSDDERKKAQEEQQRRTSNYLCLLAKGREKQGRLVEAFQAYLDFGVQAAKQDEVTVIDEPDVKAPPDVWAQGRISAMIASANPTQRKPLEDEIVKKWQAVKGSDLEALRRFVSMFGSAFSVGKEARLQLAERLIEENPVNTMLEAERHLLVLREQGDPALAARAVDDLARLATRNGRLDDAAFYYRVLGRDYPDIVVRDGRKGSDLYEDLATDKRFLPYYDDRSLARAGKWVANPLEHGSFSMQQNLFVFETEDETLPFFQRHRLVLNLQNHQFKLLDRQTNEERWSVPLTKTNFQTFTNWINQPNSTIRFPYHVNGHLVVLNLGQMVYGLDPLNRKVLWEKSLVGAGSLPNNRQPTVDKDGTLLVAYDGGWTQKIGQAAPARPSHVCLLSRDGLLAIDPVNGRTLWTRTGVSSRTHVFSDGQNIYLADMNTDGNITSTKAVRAHDGVSIDVPDFGAAYGKRMRVLGRHILASETDEKVGVTLRLYDVLTGKDVWKTTAPPNSVVMRSEDVHFTGLIEPDGKLMVLDVLTGKPVLNAVIDPKDMEKAVAVHLLRDAGQFYVAMQLPTDTQVVQNGPYAGLVPNSGIRSLPVNGQIYAFEPSGKLRWKAEANHQMLVMEQFNELPIMLMASRYTKTIAVGAGRSFQSCVSLRSLDKRTGKLLFDQPEMLNAAGFFALNINLQGGRIELVGNTMKLVHRLADMPASATGSTAFATPTPNQPERLQRAVITMPAARVEIRTIVAPAKAPVPPPLPEKK
jgi:outer membrane protein assembly factor BamB